MFWFRKVGDRVRRGEPVVEIAAGWTVLDVPAPADGTITAICVAGSCTADEGSVIGTMETADAPRT
jgi:pyruvate/2-oxoglutarate dehydrogenase complex dihydrolipoamide acyltransferase (E2) component